MSGVATRGATGDRAVREPPLHPNLPEGMLATNLRETTEGTGTHRKGTHKGMLLHRAAIQDTGRVRTGGVVRQAHHERGSDEGRTWGLGGSRTAPTSESP